jgi:hypothetical protein
MVAAFRFSAATCSKVHDGISQEQEAGGCIVLYTILVIMSGVTSEFKHFDSEVFKADILLSKESAQSCERKKLVTYQPALTHCV